MNFQELLNDKSVKPKKKTEALSNWLINNPKMLNKLIQFANDSKDPLKATCIEAIEFASKTNPSIVTPECFEFVTQALTEKAPRIKWESAKVIGNTAHLFPSKLDSPIANLLTNSEHTGTVVRWSAAFALGEIIKLKTKKNSELVPAVESICKREEKNSIIKIYLAALKKIKPNS